MVVIIQVAQLIFSPIQTGTKDLLLVTVPVSHFHLCPEVAIQMNKGVKIVSDTLNNSSAQSTLISETTAHENKSARHN